ncbi:hypothetical protein O181_015795 [Austropuccinia psidii MF-1]|uniref:Uncharacterized protein n=1 Tax=Austropuccinia psidii MF-1 TaxID=1389203 RepID=A0A9Q3GRA3_9BASI|nr:hypothetical protein [Austropuccinia psidii MF-1]
MIQVVHKHSIHSSSEVSANYDWCLLINFTPTNCQAATHFQMHPSTGHTEACFTHLVDLLPPVLQPNIPLCGFPLICRCSPACTCKPEAHQHRLSTASYPLKHYTPMISDAAYFYAGIRHCRSYAGNLHTHCGTFGACLPANIHTFPLESQYVSVHRKFCTQQNSCLVACQCTVTEALLNEEGLALSEQTYLWSAQNKYSIDKSNEIREINS